MNSKLYNLVNLINDYKEILNMWYILNQEEIVILNKSHLYKILKEFIVWNITHLEIETWANIIEFNDLIEYQDENNLLNDIIFEIANPDINWILTIDKANTMLKILEK
jgi:hypothetical protein